MLGLPICSDFYALRLSTLIHAAFTNANIHCARAVSILSSNLQGKKVLFITANTGIERDELLKPMQAMKDQCASVKGG